MINIPEADQSDSERIVSVITSKNISYNWLKREKKQNRL